MCVCFVLCMYVGVCGDVCARIYICCVYIGVCIRCVCVCVCVYDQIRTSYCLQASIFVVQVYIILYILLLNFKRNRHT